MTQIAINTAEVESACSRFNQEKGNLESLLQSTKNLMNNLEAQFKGQRARKIFGAWQDMQPNLNGAVQALDTAARLLREAAAAFDQADGAA